MDNGDDGEMRGRRKVGVLIGRGGDGRHGATPHQGVHQEATDKHSGDGGLTPRLFTVHERRADDRYKPDGALVGSRHGK